MTDGSVAPTVRVRVNGHDWTGAVEPQTLLVHFLRDRLRLTGTHVGCETSSCGACTVIVDGAAVRSCTMFVMQADGSEVRTVEGLHGGDALHPVAAAFIAEGGLQCGYCTPGMIMTTVALLAETPNPSPETVRAALDGNLCRCTGYDAIVRAVLRAAGAGTGTQSRNPPTLTREGGPPRPNRGT